MAVLRQLQHKKNITFLDKSNEDGNKSNVVKVFDAIKKQQENGSSVRQLFFLRAIAFFINCVYFDLYVHTFLLSLASVMTQLTH